MSNVEPKGKRKEPGQRLPTDACRSTRMIDTVVLSTEMLDSQTWTAIQDQLQARYGVNAGTGEVDYTHYVGQITIPESAYSIRLTIRTAKWIKSPGEKAPVKVNGLRSLRVEASVHKAMLGHNAFGGPTDLLPACRWLISRLSQLLDVSLPLADSWRPHRLDIAESFDLASEDNVRSWIRSKSLSHYPRRDIQWWGDWGMTVDGYTTCLRIYAKGVEMAKHGDYRRLCMCMSPQDAMAVITKAQSLLRAEVEYKQPVWDSVTRLDQIDCTFGQARWDMEWAKLFRQADEPDTIARTSIDVEARLQSFYPGKWLDLFKIWSILAIRGEGWYRRHVNPSTWRRQRRMLESASVAWDNTDILVLTPDNDLAGFYPHLSDQRRLTATHPRVREYERASI